MNIIFTVAIILVLLAIFWRRSLLRSWRLVMFGLSTLTNGQSRLARYLTHKVDCLESTYPDNSGQLALRIYQPRGIQKQLPATIIYHGASPKGINHSAMNLLARNLARLGIRVFLPELPKLKELYFSPETYARITQFYQQVVKRPEVYEDKILLVGVSFSGGMVVKASTETDINPCGVLSFGSYFNLSETLRFFFTGRAKFGETKIEMIPHEYTKAVWFWNYLELLELPFNPGPVQTCIGHFIREEQDQVEKMFMECNQSQRDFLKQVFDPRDRTSINYLNQAETRIQSMIDKISPHNFIDQIKSPLFIVHGIQDNMVPYTQALAFGYALTEAQKSHFQYIMWIYAHSAAGKSTLGEFITEMRALFKLLNNLLKVFE